MRMVLQEILDRVPGALGAAVVGIDGIVVEKAVATRDLNIDVAAAEGINVVKRAVASSREDGAEPLEEMTISTRARCTILRVIGSDYYLCLVTGPEAIPGQARFEAWKAGLQLRQAII